MQNMSRLSIKMFLSKIQSSIKKEKNLSLYENFSEKKCRMVAYHVSFLFYLESSFSLIMLNAIKKKECLPKLFILLTDIHGRK